MNAYALKNPKGKIITWTCFTEATLPWREYRRDGARRDYSDAEMAEWIKQMEAQGYSLAHVRISEITDAGVTISKDAADTTLP